MAHILIVGGTGMLREASLYFAASGDTVSVVARNGHKLNHLTSESPHINPIAVDYRDDSVLRDKLQTAVNHFGAISLAVCWIHSIAPRASYIVAEMINKTKSPCRNFDILGSAAIKPETLQPERENDFRQFENVEYHRILLGFVIENGVSRWLTNSEISAGVINAVETNAKNYVVGTPHPWSARP